MDERGWWLRWCDLGNTHLCDPMAETTMTMINTYWNTPECQMEQCKECLRARFEESLCRAFSPTFFSILPSRLDYLFLIVGRTHTAICIPFLPLLRLWCKYCSLFFGSRAHSRGRRVTEIPPAEALGCDWNECAKDNGLEPTSLYTTWSSNLIVWLDQWNDMLFAFFFLILFGMYAPHRGDWGTCPLALLYVRSVLVGQKKLWPFATSMSTCQLLLKKKKESIGNRKMKSFVYVRFSHSVPLNAIEAVINGKKN